MSITAAIITTAAAITQGSIEAGQASAGAREARRLADVQRGDELRTDKLNLGFEDRKLDLGQRRIGHQGFMTAHRGQMLRDEQKRLEDTADLGQVGMATSTPLMGFTASKQKQLQDRSRRTM